MRVSCRFGFVLTLTFMIKKRLLCLVILQSYKLRLNALCIASQVRYNYGVHVTCKEKCMPIYFLNNIHWNSIYSESVCKIDDAIYVCVLKSHMFVRPIRACVIYQNLILYKFICPTLSTKSDCLVCYNIVWEKIDHDFVKL